MLQWIHVLIFRLRPEPQFITDELDYYWEDDFIDIKNFHRAEGKNFRQRRRMLRKRRNWYLRHGLFDWAEDIDTALRSAKNCSLI